MRRPLVFLAASFLLLCAAAHAAAQVPGAPTGAARGLPSTVIAAFEKAHPGGTVTSASQDRDQDEIVFRVTALDGKRRLALVYALDGSLIESAEEVNESDLPAAVAQAVHATGKVTYVKGAKVTRGIRVYYEVTVRGSRKATMTIKPDGTVVTSK